MAERAKELRSLLMQVEEESEKAGLKLSIQTTKIMASGPVTSWQIDGERVRDIFFIYIYIFGSAKSLQMVNAFKKLKDACSLEEKQ